MSLVPQIIDLLERTDRSMCAAAIAIEIADPEPDFKGVNEALRRMKASGVVDGRRFQNPGANHRVRYYWLPDRPVPWKSGLPEIRDAEARLSTAESTPPNPDRRSPNQEPSS